MASTLRMTFQAYGNTPAYTIDVMAVSTDVEQTLNIGSQSTGAGAGRVTFNPFSFTKKPDGHSADFWTRVCSGTPFQRVSVDVLAPAGNPYVSFTMGLVAVKTVAFSAVAGDGSPVEVVSMEYGHAAYSACPQNADGSFGKPIASGWDRVRNVSETPQRWAAPSWITGQQPGETATGEAKTGGFVCLLPPTCS